MRILFIADPDIAVPPLHYGGIERVVSDLAEEYVARGHQVTIWAGPGSQSPGALWTFGRSGANSKARVALNTLQVMWRLRREHRDFDVIHNFGRLAYLGSVLRSRTRKVHTYMRRIDPKKIRLADRLGARELQFTAVSQVIADTAGANGGNWKVVYNCTSKSRYQPNFDVDTATAPLAFLGRLERCKGAHTAIQVAIDLGRTLLIAGNISTLPEELEYFESEIKPKIDGEQIQYLGPVADAAKNDLLANSAALLSPVEWLEPFPIIIPEALMCGTPVIAFDRGGMSEGIDNGGTGYICKNYDEMLNAVKSLGSIDQKTCRRVGEERFSVEAVADAYHSIYTQSQ